MGIVIGIATTVVALIVLSQSMRFGFSAYLNAQKGSAKEVLPGDPNAHFKALIVYQPGITPFSRRVAYQIAAGMNARGYEVTLDHPGYHLSSGVSQYALVVFSSPAYSGRSSRTLTDYMSRIEAPSSCRIVLISTGGFKFYMELDEMERALRGINAYKKVKFVASGGNDNNMIAYNLGLELSK